MRFALHIARSLIPDRDWQRKRRDCRRRGFHLTGWAQWPLSCEHCLEILTEPKEPA